MAEDQGQDKTEEATPERREEFRERGDIAVSRDVSSTFVFFIAIGFISIYTPYYVQSARDILRNKFEMISVIRVSMSNILPVMGEVIWGFVVLVFPLFAVITVAAVATTLIQSQFNFSWKKVTPDYNKIDPFKGLARMVSAQSFMEVVKGIFKMAAISIAAYFVLKNEWVKIPALLRAEYTSAWEYWWNISQTLFFSVSILMLGIAGMDYAFQYFQLEKQMRMSKQEIKEEYKKREVDPMVRQRMRRMQRDFGARRMLDKVPNATVILTNPTHYSVALQYEFGMRAPIVLAKGKDFLALRIREEAKKYDIPLVENKPLARALFANVELDQEIPSDFFKAVSEVIRFVYQKKGIKLPVAKKQA